MRKYVIKPAATPPGGFRIDYERALNPQQLEVVRAGDGPMLVIAGAGSGKTRTLTYRVARLIECGVAPSSVLLLTFTNKAAREMLKRIEALLGGDLRLLGGTFHHVGNVVLRRYAPLVGLQPNFTILDREDAADVFAALTAGAAQRLGRAFPKPDVLLEIASFALNTEASAESVIREKFPQLMPGADEILRAIKAYGLRKRELNLVDFDDMLVLWRDLLRKNDDVRAESHARWPYVLVDEYQDTNRLQSDICEMIAGPDGNLMVVGDDAQSIYSFRGANFGNIIDFPERFPGARLYKLETNYRSTPEILALANSSIAHNKRQFEKTLRASRPSGPLPERVSVGTPIEQARFVAQRLAELRDEAYDWGDVAVLYRAHWHSMELQMELARRGVPFTVRSGLRFFEQAHIKDVAAFMRLVVNPRDEFAWKRAVRLYPRIGNAAADRLWQAVAATPDPIAAAVSGELPAPRGARDGWNEFVTLLRKVAEPALRSTPSEMIQQILDGGYELHLQTTYPNWSARADDVRRLGDYAARYKDVQDLLSELALTMNVAGQEAVEAAESDDVVVLSTVHQAKGLEWRAVFGLWLVDGRLPDQRALREVGGEEEERRLFYVLCTRAKDRLFLVQPVIGMERGIGVVQRASRFLTEIDPKTYEEVRAGYEPRYRDEEEDQSSEDIYRQDDPYKDGYG